MKGLFYLMKPIEYIHDIIEFILDEIILYLKRPKKTRTRRDMGIYTPPPPPMPWGPADFAIEPPKELPPPKMVSGSLSELIEINKQLSLKNKPTTTSDFGVVAGNIIIGNPLPLEYYQRYCGTTENFMYSGSTNFYGTIEKDESNLDESPLRRMLMKKFKWIEDVTEVKKSKGRPIEVHITVSPLHHTELMIPSVEKIVRDKLYEELDPLVKCMYPESNKDKPVVIFSPSHSETILEYFK